MGGSGVQDGVACEGVRVAVQGRPLQGWTGAHRWHQVHVPVGSRFARCYYLGQHLEDIRGLSVSFLTTICQCTAPLTKKFSYEKVVCIHTHDSE